MSFSTPSSLPISWGTSTTEWFLVAPWSLRGSLESTTLTWDCSGPWSTSESWLGLSLGDFYLRKFNRKNWSWLISCCISGLCSRFLFSPILRLLLLSLDLPQGLLSHCFSYIFQFGLTCTGRATRPSGFPTSNWPLLLGSFLGMFLQPFQPVSAKQSLLSTGGFPTIFLHFVW